MKKRFSAFLLAALMVAALLPTMSFAAVENKTAATAAELKQAIEAATGETVITLTGNVTGNVVAQIQAGANVTIDGNGYTVSGGMWLGKNAQTYNGAIVNASVTVKNCNFTGTGLVIVDIKTATVENNKFTNITLGQGTDIPTPDALNIWFVETATVTGNEINGTGEVGIACSYGTSATITGNTVKNTRHNSIQVNGSAATSTTVTGNTLENWGLGGEGRAFRGQPAAGGTVTFNSNDMIYTANDGDAPEGYAKVDVTTSDKIDLDNNYWNGKTNLTGLVTGNVTPSDVSQIATTKVNVAPAYAGPVMNWVKVNAANNGVVKSGPLAASAGATVTLYPKAAEGYVLDTVEVLDAEGNAVALDGLKFAIPAGGVTVNAAFKLAD